MVVFVRARQTLGALHEVPGGLPSVRYSRGVSRKHLIDALADYQEPILV